MNLLAIETSSSEATIAIQRGKEQWQLSLGAQRQQIGQILPVVDTLLEKSGLSLVELEGLAFSAGPGSFTGLRVALGVLQGLSMPFSLPIAAISSLQALAQKHYRLFGNKTVICARNAYMQQVYYGCYQLDPLVMHPKQQDSLLDPAQVPLLDADASFAGDGWAVYQQEIAGAKARNLENVVVAADAVDIIELAQSLDQWQALEDVQINYLRSKDAWLR